MLQVGIREFKQRASELVRYVCETGQEVQITTMEPVWLCFLRIQPGKKLTAQMMPG